MRDTILLTGKFSDILGDIKDALSEHYDIQICSLQLENMEGMIKLIKPSMMVVCAVGIKLNPNILEWLKRNTGKIPVLFIAAREDCAEIDKICYGERYHSLYPPVHHENICALCREILQPKKSRPFETEPVLQPTPQPVIQPKPQPVPRPETGQRRKILAIDDSATVLRSLKNMLKDRYDVIMATSGEMGIERAISEQPDIILLDYEMPDMDGSETYRELLEHEETVLIPVIFLTGVHDHARVRDVVSLHPADYVLKPVDAASLNERLDMVIRKWNL